jgi:hypothetical protein
VTQVAVMFNPGAGGMRHDAGMASGSRHISERIDRALAVVYEYASDPANLYREDQTPHQGNGSRGGPVTLKVFAFTRRMAG